jgi:hypothetical protein
MQPVKRLHKSVAVEMVENILESDRYYFEMHPEEEEFIREFCPGEFGKAELPEIPEGFRYATCVSRIWRDGKPIGRYRNLMTVCDDVELLKRMAAEI